MTVKTKQKAEIAPPATDHMLHGEYPMTWDAFIGQDVAKRQLRTAARAAKLQSRPLPHTLLADGAQGIGKTSLALLAANEMGHCKLASGQIKATEARLLFAGMADGDVLIIDEIHQLVQTSRRDSEWLLHYLQDGVLLGPVGIEEQPKVTIIGCSTEVARLPVTVLQRFKLRPPLTRYNEKQATAIAAITAGRIFTAPMAMPTPANCKQVAIAANYNPRVIRNLLETLSDITVCGDSIYRRGRGYDLALMLEWFGLTPDGLDALSQRYLICLLEDFQGVPTGKTAMMDRLQEPGGLDFVEQLLQDKGYLAKVKSGRALTQAGIRRARALQGL